MMGQKEIEMLLAATLKIIDSAKKASDANNIRAEIAFINLFVETLVSRTLADKANAGSSKTQHAESLKNNYGKLKLGIQEAVATGFETSMQKFSKQPIEFYCTIKPVVEGKTSTSH